MVDTSFFGDILPYSELRKTIGTTLFFVVLHFITLNDNDINLQMLASK